MGLYFYLSCIYVSFSHFGQVQPKDAARQHGHTPGKMLHALRPSPAGLKEGTQGAGCRKHCSEGANGPEGRQLGARKKRRCSMRMTLWCQHSLWPDMTWTAW